MHVLFIPRVKFILCSITQSIFLHSHENGCTSLSEKPKKMKLEIFHAENTTTKIFLEFVIFEYAKSNVPNRHISSNK